MYPRSKYHDSLHLDEGLYEFAAPDVFEIIPQLIQGDLISVSKFGVLQDAWGTSYCMPTLLFWREHTHDRDKIHPCTVWLEGTGSEPVLIFGPFRDREELNNFKDEFQESNLPWFPETDYISAVISD